MIVEAVGRGPCKNGHSKIPGGRVEEWTFTGAVVGKPRCRDHTPLLS